MIALKLKQQQGTTTTNVDITTSGAWKRCANDQRELSEDLPQQIKIRFPDPKNIVYFEVDIKPDENIWSQALISFTVQVTEDYPISPPKVLCKKRIFHPNIDLEGKVCLNILRDDWKPISTLKEVLYGLLLLFLTPNPKDPLNKEAAEIMLKDLDQFKQIARQTMRGGTYGGITFDKIA